MAQPGVATDPRMARAFRTQETADTWHNLRGCNPKLGMLALAVAEGGVPCQAASAKPSGRSASQWSWIGWAPRLNRQFCLNEAQPSGRNGGASSRTGSAGRVPDLRKHQRRRWRRAKPGYDRFRLTLVTKRPPPGTRIAQLLGVERE